MRKTLSLLFALVLCLSLCACGNGANNEAEKIAEAYEWKTLYTKEETDDTPGSLKVIQDVLEFRSDGVGRSYHRSRYWDGTKWTEYGHLSFTWEVKGDYIHISYGGSTQTFEIITVGKTLKGVSNGCYYSTDYKNG